jgi:ribosomal-protein-alanine N-acetyltransferase
MSQRIFTIRTMERRDLAEVERIQDASPEASHWKAEDYLGYESFVAECEGRIAGFAVARRIPPDEVEILNVATDPAARRQGVGSALVQALLNLTGKVWFLEVRESNAAARALYERAGFTVNGRRKNYYPALETPEDLPRTGEPSLPNQERHPAPNREKRERPALDATAPLRSRLRSAVMPDQSREDAVVMKMQK